MDRSSWTGAAGVMADARAEGEAAAGSGDDAAQEGAWAGIARMLNHGINQAAAAVARGGNSTHGHHKDHPLNVQDEVIWITDRTLYWCTRILGLIFLLIVVGALVAYKYWKGLTHVEAAPTKGGFRPSRFCHKLKQCLYRCCCCGCLCPSMYEALLRKFGMDTLKPGVAETLRITLIGASNIQRRVDLYFEAWTEPAEGHPKNSRIHQQAIGSVDLGSEVLEMDWFGDEEEVVINAVRYSGKQVSHDTPIATLSIPGDAIKRYAREARQSSNPANGARLFSLRVKPDSEKQRNRRFRGDPSPVMPFIIKSLQEGRDDTEELRKEIALLRNENQKLGGRTHRNTSGTHNESESGEVMMNVVVRFEIITPKRYSAQETATLFRSPSYEALEQDQYPNASSWA